MLCRASRRLDLGPTSLDGSTADREVARSGPTVKLRPTRFERPIFDEIIGLTSKTPSVHTCSAKLYV